MKPIIIKLILILIFVFNFNAYCADKSDIKYFNIANENYNKADYLTALENYYKINNKTYSVYFNIGNCYAKLNNKGKALYFYKIAKSIKPNNDRINTNINIIRASRQDKFEIKKNAVSALTENIIDSYSLRFIFILTSVIFWCLSLTACLILFFKNKILNILIVFLGCLFIVILPFFVFKIVETDKGILIENNVKLFSEPLENSTEIAELNEATEVKISGYTDKWAEVTVADTHKGWLQKKSMLIIKK